MTTVYCQGGSMGMAAAKDVVGGVSAPGYDEAPDLPLAEAALQVRMTREQILRAVMRGVIRGGLRGGRWYCDRDSVAAYARGATAAGPR